LPLSVHADSSAAIGICRRSGIGRVRHLAVGQLWVQDHLRRGTFRLFKVRGDENPADLCTKHLARTVIDGLIEICGIAREAGCAISAPRLNVEAELLPTKPPGGSTLLAPLSVFSASQTHLVCTSTPDGATANRGFPRTCTYDETTTTRPPRTIAHSTTTPRSHTTLPQSESLSRARWGGGAALGPGSLAPHGEVFCARKGAPGNACALPVEPSDRFEFVAGSTGVLGHPLARVRVAVPCYDGRHGSAFSLEAESTGVLGRLQSVACSRVHTMTVGMIPLEPVPARSPSSPLFHGRHLAEGRWRGGVRVGRRTGDRDTRAQARAESCFWRCK